jgi:hypothetical protein
MGTVRRPSSWCLGFSSWIWTAGRTRPRMFRPTRRFLFAGSRSGFPTCRQPSQNHAPIIASHEAIQLHLDVQAHHRPDDPTGLLLQSASHRRGRIEGPRAAARAASARIYAGRDHRDLRASARPVQRGLYRLGAPIHQVAGNNIGLARALSRACGRFRHLGRFFRTGRKPEAGFNAGAVGILHRGGDPLRARLCDLRTPAKCGPNEYRSVRISP